MTSGNASGRNLPGRERDQRDFYRTPRWCVDALYVQLPSWPRPTLDPCAGDGALLFPQTRGVELDPQLAEKDSRIRQGDGLEIPWQNEHVILNPPYKEAERWVTKAVQEGATAVVLLRLGYLASLKRYSFWTEHRPEALAILSRRPSFAHGRTDSSDYVWCLWQSQQSLFGEAPRVFWIK